MVEKEEICAKIWKKRFSSRSLARYLIQLKPPKVVLCQFNQRPWPIISPYLVRLIIIVGRLMRKITSGVKWSEVKWIEMKWGEVEPSRLK